MNSTQIQKVLKNWFGQLFLTIIFVFPSGRILSYFLFISFPLPFPKVHIIGFLKSEKKVVEVGRGLKRSTHPTPLLKQGHPDLCVDSFWIFCMSDTTKSLDNLCQSLVILPITKCWSLRAPPVFHFMCFAFWASHCFYNSNFNLLMRLFTHQKPLINVHSNIVW